MYSSTCSEIFVVNELHMFDGIMTFKKYETMLSELQKFSTNTLKIGINA